jgi:hypothetical protein
MPHPAGISGGGIWFIPLLPMGEICSAQKYKLVGINRAYLKNTVLGIRMYHWLKLVLSDHPELRESIEPV